MYNKNIGHLEGRSKLKMIAISNIYSGLKMMYIEMPNSPYSNRCMPLRTLTEYD